MSEKNYEDTLNRGAKNVKQEDLGTVAAKADQILETVSRVEILKKFAAQAALLIRMISDYYNGVYKDVPWASIAMAVFALLYVLNPVDLIPDYLPVIGFVDDAAVMELAWLAIKHDVKDYAAGKCENAPSDRLRDLVNQAFPDMGC